MQRSGVPSLMLPHMPLVPVYSCVIYGSGGYCCRCAHRRMVSMPSHTFTYQTIYDSLPITFLHRFKPLGGSWLTCDGQEKKRVIIQEAHQDFDQVHVDEISRTARRRMTTATVLVTFSPMGSIVLYHPDHDLRHTEPPVRIMLPNAGKSLFTYTGSIAATHVCCCIICCAGDAIILLCNCWHSGDEFQPWPNNFHYRGHLYFVCKSWPRGPPTLHCYPTVSILTHEIACVHLWVFLCAADVRYPIYDDDDGELRLFGSPGPEVVTHARPLRLPARLMLLLLHPACRSSAQKRPQTADGSRPVQTKHGQKRHGRSIQDFIVPDGWSSPSESIASDCDSDATA